MSGLIAGSGLLTLLAAGIGLVGGALLLLLLRRLPRVAVAMWLVALSFLPVWVGASAGGIHLPAASVVAVLVILAVVPVPDFRVSLLDVLVILMGAAALAGLVVGTDEKASATTLVTFLTYGLPGYLLGRLAAHRIGMASLQAIVAVVFTVVAALAVVEFALHWNPFVLLPGNSGLRASWSALQIRGGITRAEGAFGHSIALGSSLAIAIPLTLASRFGLPTRLGMTSVMLLGAVLSFSRVGMLGAVLGLVLAVLFLRDAISLRVRVTVVGVLVAVVAVIAPFVQTVFDDAGTEATNSSDYRGDLYGLVPGMRILGLASSAHRGTDGRVFYGGFRSIDSQLVLTGLTFGLLVAAAVLVALAVGIWLVLRGRATAATIALVAQIPALASVALITQYATLVYFLAGVAATSQILRRQVDTVPPSDPVGVAADSEDRPDPTRTTALPPLPERTPSR
ncbi:hypothetical protein ABID70_000065 [Clavibacter michiganensis]|uniref:hypothetical protein n=1 Tax=Clavibacter michiganensis TaxID=28447 RepID=UPI001AE2F217|nr:hypothetical protein [Clavibacter michiganensis]MBP2457507.1 hypothetical protein [Clavibacter michiganensis]MDQ0410077.1 hypothetical protein [Clavibacter michiganensis]